MGFVDSLKTLNATARTILLTALVGVLGFAAYFGYSEYTARDRLFKDQQEQIDQAQAELSTLKGELQQKDAEISQLGVQIQQKDEQIEKLETSMQLLKTDQRLARLRVLDIERDEDGNAVRSRLEFVELSPGGEPLSEARQFELPGDLVYVDNWIIKFDDSYIEKGDIQRGTSLCLFRRIFSEDQLPAEGFSLDEVGMRPQAYARGGAISDFEKQLWSEFWEFANDPKKASEMGIRAANGEAVSIKVRENHAYNIELRASGGLSIQPIDSTNQADAL